MEEEFTGRKEFAQEMEFPWHNLKEDLTDQTINIEPGETEQLTHGFIIPREVKDFMASAWVSDISRPGEGWYRRSPNIKRQGEQNG